MKPTDEMIEAGARALKALYGAVAWENTDDERKSLFRNDAAAVLVAALAAIPEPLPDGHVRRGGKVMVLRPWGSILTRLNDDGSVCCNHTDREPCRLDHETESTYRLVPVEVPNG